MKKIIFETKSISGGVSIEANVECENGTAYDTSIYLVGNFTVSGDKRQEFYEKLGELIDEYRI